MSLSVSALARCSGPPGHRSHREGGGQVRAHCPNRGRVDIRSSMVIRQRDGRTFINCFIFGPTLERTLTITQRGKVRVDRD